MSFYTLAARDEARAKLLRMRPNRGESTTDFFARFDETREEAEMNTTDHDKAIVNYLVRVIPSAQLAQALRSWESQKRFARMLIEADPDITAEAKAVEVAGVNKWTLSFHNFRTFVEVAEEIEEEQREAKRKEEEERERHRHQVEETRRRLRMQDGDDDMKWFELFKPVKQELQRRDAELGISNQHQDEGVDRAGKLRRGECFKCGVQGHIARFCHYQTSSSRANRYNRS